MYNNSIQQVSSESLPNNSISGKKPEKTNISIFQDEDGDNRVSENDFRGDTEALNAVKKHGYMNLLWSAVGNIVNSIIARTKIQNANKFDGKIDVTQENFTNYKNQILIHDKYEELVSDFQKSSDKSKVYQIDGIKVTITKEIERGEERIVTKMYNSEGQLLQKVSTGETMRNSGNIKIMNYDNTGKETSYLLYNADKSLQILDVEEDNVPEGSKFTFTRYLPSRDGGVTIRFPDASNQKYDAKGKAIKK